MSGRRRRCPSCACCPRPRRWPRRPPRRSRATWPRRSRLAGVAHWVTTGGSSAPGIYHHLGRPPLRERVDWSRVHVWWGDDRFVPSDHPLSNALPLNQILLASGGDEETGSPEGADVGGQGDGVRIPAAQLHEVPVTEAIARSGGAAWAAVRYAAEIERAGPAAGPNGDPVFDVLIMGVGPDGHVLSIFPGSAVWDASGRLPSPCPPRRTSSRTSTG